MNLESTERGFTEQELKKYNGERKMPIYIAYNGLVYDVTSSPHWRGGEHRNLHYSGIDLTDELGKSGDQLLSRNPHFFTPTYFASGAGGAVRRSWGA